MTCARLLGASPALVLVVDHDREVRNRFRTGLEAEDLTVVEAASASQARALLGEPVVGVVLALDERGSSGLQADLSRHHPMATVVVPGEPGAPARDDIAGIVCALGPLVGTEPTPADVGGVAADWLQLCHWDPALPPDNRPPIARTVVAAVSAALERPQPLGWGLDPLLEPVVDAFVLNGGPIDVCLGQLVCLRDAFERRMGPVAAPGEGPESESRLSRVVCRMMATAAASAMARLTTEAVTDSLTGLGNRRAFEEDLARERSRLARHGRPLSLAVIDLDGLKEINDTRGHGAGDDALRAMAGALGKALRREDTTYRVGGDEFAVLLPDATGLSSGGLAGRLAEAGAPRCSLGLATSPPDDASRLLELADRRLYEGRRARGFYY